MSKIAQELNKIMAGDEPLSNLEITQTGTTSFAVLSARNGGATMHQVDLAEMDCSCEDMQYNNEGDDICAHLAKAVLVSDSQWSPELEAMDAYASMLAETRGIIDRLKGLETDLKAGSNPTTGTSETEPEPDFDPVEMLEEFLESSGVPPEEIQIDKVNDKLRFGPDGYLDDSNVYGNFVEFSQENEEIEFTPDKEGHDNQIWIKDVNQLEAV